MAVLVTAALLTGACGRNRSGAGNIAPSDTTGTAVLTFAAPEHSFGTVMEGEKVGCIFTFTNTGDADLVISSASASCGCTVPKFDKKTRATRQIGHHRGDLRYIRQGGSSDKNCCSSVKCRE